MGPGEATVVARSSSREMHVSPLTSHGLLREAQQHVPSITFQHPPPKEGCRELVLGVWPGSITV